MAARGAVAFVLLNVHESALYGLPKTRWNTTIFFLVLAAIVIPLANYMSAKTFDKSERHALESMPIKKYVLDTATVGKRLTVTRVWSLFDEPLSLYFQISNRDLPQSLAGRVGSSIVRVVTVFFHRMYVLRANCERLARQVLTPDLIDTLIRMERFRFVAGSAQSLWLTEKVFQNPEDSH